VRTWEKRSTTASNPRQCGVPSRRLPLLAGLALAWLAAAPAIAFTPLSSNQLVFVCVDHAPVGACSTITYGLDHADLPYAGVRGDACGLGMSSPDVPYGFGYYPGCGGGVLIALTTAAGTRSLPYLAWPSNVTSDATFFGSNEVQRVLTPGTDDLWVSGAGLHLTHYSPAWSMPSLDAASLADKRRFFLPATWVVISATNTGPASEDLYFGLRADGAPASFAGGAYSGFTVGEAALAVQRGSCQLLSGPALSAALNGMTQGFAFHVTVPPGQTRALTLVVAYYRSSAVDTRLSAKYYYTSLFPSMDAVIDAAFAGFADARGRCAALASALSGQGLNPYRQFLASHAMHSYMADTACLLDPGGGVHWYVPEGYYDYINTFDLTVDLAFYESLMHPWTLRNVLDLFSGSPGTNGYYFDDPLYDAHSGAPAANHGFSFFHDMGGWPDSHAPMTGPQYDVVMGQEELQTWILGAGLYWSRTGDAAWLTNNASLLRTCLDSMLSRDNPDPSGRDGVTKFINAGEISTFDSLPASLLQSAYSGRMVVRNWACYLALQAMFLQIGDATSATTCAGMAAAAATTIANAWESQRSGLGYIPALLDGSDPSATIPMVEGLAYPLQMGLTNALDAVAGPYSDMLRALSNHLAAVLVPGLCIDSVSKVWEMTSARDYRPSPNTWQSKMYLCQYVAENVLGFSGPTVNVPVDQAHATVQMQCGPYLEWTDQTDGSGAALFAGGGHYPRGITSALWWLTATNNPGYPVATAPPGAPASLAAFPGDRQVLLIWNGAALASAYNVKRSNRSGGPYLPAASGLQAASFTDTNVADLVTYYYVVTATNLAGEGPASAEVSATPTGPVPSVGTNLAVSVSAGSVTIAWPEAYVGWVLQTNALALRNPMGWGDVPWSATNDQLTVPAGPSDRPTEFFRLRRP
jgi:hypothetical protein